ncbi:pyruvate dehydrogenase (acetyl-transferring), homodimeric type [Gilvimarinus agarilyticus]|uniref:pyruvate dehydrogenase (acetyl-transferring), homodimeric type n=1 Tax=unclassified Gilvimarinus TaxID=2642066 RepID=UPI001C07EEEE|nr:MULTISPECIES: pyruvate dehydrogenase (acetyl-transferring), homodimeric type [unclassified Gilvimarinus]MBU2887336.1 pyruvate dehydrogenase (acetyl-transferring), homodimeric type [Gilvimarinus agarilyticus]MDO6571995.1 pyruvate dehydrogenase (acetyl-transferring), homodimeric type [Gilvimarinus sp. 2_MG-2023]MDO6746063.1 pyruvate dehydrogenase (acetyl-transferring), homodimeric type [Gilvimarinus sp. 1_MG-2023]
MIEDIDALETREWRDALESVVRHGGMERAAFLLKSLSEAAADHGIDQPSAITTPYRNTIPPAKEVQSPGDSYIEQKIRSIIRWNAIAMVVRANKNSDELGGHIASFSSAATLYEVGFNHFFRGNEDGPGDLVYFQGHSSPGMYARSYVEGRLSEDQLDNFRREVDGVGLSSYPHPWLMPDYWQFPTVSMGLGPIGAIYQAHVMRYMDARGLIDKADRKIWAFLGDGECDEPESLGAISLAGREKLDNLIFVINCNLQRLDGPVRGNAKIVQELEGVFRGAGWNVIKVLWGGGWDALLEKDKTGLLQKRMDEVCDGEMQNYKANGGAYTRENFFGKYPELLELVKDMSDDEILHLARGGHDSHKVYNAYHQAVNTKGQPTVVLAQTVKGYGMGPTGEAVNNAHQVKKLDLEGLKTFRDRFNIPIEDKDLENIPYYRPPEDSAEMQYLQQRRKELNGYLPERQADFEALDIPSLEAFKAQLKGTGEREISTTMAFVRVLNTLLKDKNIGEQVVPIVPDEARTFGMEGMFRQVGIYSAFGQKYTPQDAGQIMYYKEDEKGQILEEGINEAGAMAAWVAAATSYSNHDKPLLPFYIYYSMFGFQRIGDLAWLAGDAQARGFMLGGTAGRTTLNGEGLQHQDGHSHIMANTIPNCRSYDPTYSYEVAVIVQDGLKRMYQDKENGYYYITLMNENYVHPDMPEGAEEGIIKGLYQLEKGTSKKKNRVQLLGSGTILNEVRAAAEILRNDFSVEADVWSVTSVNELTRDGQAAERWNLLNPTAKPRKAYITEQLEGAEGPFIIATDYMKNYAEQLRAFVPGEYRVLGTDGFGRSDSRQKLRHFFEVSREFVVIAALKSLADQGAIKVDVVAKAIKQFGIDPDKADPLTV